jgi:phosphoesterase RecJ-like protein
MSRTDLESQATYQEAFEAILEVFRSAPAFVLTTHLNPDGDGLGCEAALAAALRQLGKKVKVVNHDPLPEVYRFLPLQEMLEVAPLALTGEEVVVYLECPSQDRAGACLQGLHPDIRTINIDHHVFNTHYGTYNLVDPGAAAAGEQIWDLLKALGVEISEAVGIGVYTAIATDTGQFMYASVTGKTHRIVAELLDAGLPHDQINQQIYQQLPLSTIRLLSKALGTLSSQNQGRVCSFHVTRSMLRATGALPSQTENFVNYARAIQGVEVAVFFQEMGTKKIKISLRSRGKIDVFKIAHALGGGGHRRAAGVTLEHALSEARERVLELVDHALAE